MKTPALLLVLGLFAECSAPNDQSAEWTEVSNSEATEA
jgi:hypothetical protein